jgi:hypothetical protein
MGFGFTDNLQVVTTSNYNTITNFHTLQITAAHAKSFRSAVSSPVTARSFNDFLGVMYVQIWLLYHLAFP